MGNAKGPEVCQMSSSSGAVRGSGQTRGRSTVLRSKSRARSLVGHEVGVVTILVIVVVAFTLLSGNFFTASNINVLLLDATVVMLLAMGQSFVLLTGNIDLSVGALAAFSGVLLAIVINAGVPWELAIVVVCAATAAAGFLNGLMVHRLRIPSFLATFGMLGVGETLALVLSSDRSVPVTVAGLGLLSEAKGLPVAFWVTLGVAVIFWVVARRTTFGFQLYAYGGNPKGATQCGVKTGPVVIGAFMLSGLVAGLAGSVTTSQLLAGYPSSGTGSALFDCIAGAVLGGVSLFGGVGSIVGAVIGALVIGTIKDGMNVIGLSYSWQPLVIGAVIVAGVAYDIKVRQAGALTKLIKRFGPKGRGTSATRDPDPVVKGAKGAPSLKPLPPRVPAIMDKP